MTPLPSEENKSSNKVSKKAARQLPVFLTLCFVVLPLAAAAFYVSLGVFRDLQDFTFSRRQTIAFLIAATMQEKLDRVVDIGTSLSTRVQFQKLIEAGKWDEAITILEKVPKDFPYIARLALFDPKGVLMAVTPLTPEISAVIGQDFSYRDYYQGVSKNWEPYIAEAIKPAVPLGYNLVPAAIPIKSVAGKVLGVLLLNIKLDTVAEWVRTIDVGPAGFVYIVDQKGHLIAHPTLSSGEDIVDFSSVPSVRNVLKGERGVEVIFNQIENEKRVTAYEPVPRYGWGVVVVQPTRTAFVERNREVRRMAAVMALVILAVGFFTGRLLRNRAVMRAQRDSERTLLESIGDGVFAIDRSFYITKWNRAAGILTGYGDKEALGKPMREIVKFISESDRKENIVFIEEAMLYGEVRVMEVHTLLMRKDGSEIAVGDSAAPVFDDAGRVVGAIIVFRDVSKEHELQEKEKELKKLKDEFLFRTVHDLRAPANAVRLVLENFKEEGGIEKYPQLKEDYGLIQEANSRMRDLVENLLKVASGEKRELVPKKDVINLVGLVGAILKEAAPASAKKRVTIAYTPETTPSVIGDEESLKEVFANLIDNGIKYNNDGGTLAVSHAVAGSFLKTAIQDTGKGISPEGLAKLFTPYFRGDVGKETPGTGLGLYIVKGLVEKMGGTVKVASQVGEGTTFTVSMPIA